MLEETENNFPKTQEEFELHRLEEAKPGIRKLFDSFNQHVFKKTEISSVFSNHRETLNISSATNVRTILEYLTSELSLKEVKIPSSYESSEKRYVWGNPSAYEVACSLRKNSYLCHGSAVFLHGLNDQIPHTIYLNYEQSRKPASESILTQVGIERAFAGRQRQSKLYYEYENSKITIINGKNTKQLEVGEIELQDVILPITNVERTLIDITVRPAYSGGIFEVLEAYKNAKEQISVNILVATLKKLDYVYPYHQSIGFYMEKAGFAEKQFSKLLKLGTDFDFYIDYHLPKKQNYDKKWRLFYPDGF